MFLNTLFVPSDRPSTCGFNFGTDLSISLDDGVTTVQTGQTLTYTIVVTNHGPSRVVGATMIDNLPLDISNVTWTGAILGGAVIPTASGNGNIHQTVDLPVGGSIIYTARGTVGSPLSCQITNRASIQLPVDMTDTHPENNEAQDVDRLTVPVRAPSDLTVECLGDVPLPATTLAQFQAQGGSAPGDCCAAPATAIHLDDTNNGGAGCVSNPLIITRRYRVTNGCGDV
ncbi:MAG TPA: hypothetical protein VK633_10750, partial [Verrucomicrobiae bacterium]|nr:hypothetical protein [Verrucomicrobiae bacterium]